MSKLLSQETLLTLMTNLKRTGLFNRSEVNKDCMKFKKTNVT